VLDNYYTLDSHDQDFVGTGYDYGMISDPNIGFNGWGKSMDMICPGGAFSLISMWMTPAWENGLVVYLEGYAGGDLKAIFSVTLASTAVPGFFEAELASFTELDTLTIITSASQVVVDDMTIKFISPCDVMRQEVGTSDERAAAEFPGYF